MKYYNFEKSNTNIKCCIFIYYQVQKIKSKSIVERFSINADSNSQYLNI